jgi:tetratricopeptide (TPR) repeat protein
MRVHPGESRARYRYARVEQSLGEVLFGKGDAKTAAQHLEAAAPILEQWANRPGAPADDLPEAGSVYGVLGDLFSGSLAGGLNIARAEGYYRKCLALDLRALDRDPNLARARSGVAVSKLKLGTILQDVRTPEAIGFLEAGMIDVEKAKAAGQSNYQNLRLEALLHNHLAYTLAIAGRSDEAVVHGKESVRINESFAALDPANQRALIDAATAWFSYGNAVHTRVEERGGRQDMLDSIEAYLKSLALCKAVLKTQPGNPVWNSEAVEINYRLSTLSRRNGQPAAADRYWKEARDLAIQMAEAKDAIAMSLQKGVVICSASDVAPDLWDLPRAVRYGERLNRMTEHSHPDYLHLLGRVYRLSNRLDEAQAILEKAATLAPPPKPGEPITRIRRQVEEELARLKARPKR